MTDKAIPDLTAASLPLSGAELIHVVQGGNSRKVALNRIHDAFDGGWGHYVDSATALEANAQTLTAGQRTLLTIDGLGTTNTTYVNGSGIQWVDNEHRNPTLGDSWTWRVFLRAKKSGGTTAYLYVEQDIGDGAGPVIGGQEIALRSDNQTQTFTFNFTGYTSSTFVSNGLRFYITASNTCQIWAKSVFIRRDFHRAPVV